MTRRYTLESLGLNDIEYVPDAHVSLDYQGAPTASELEDEILSGIHTNPDGSVGCLLCGCVDMFYREFNTKGRRYRCMSCFYNSESQFESVKSQKDITLSSFGLVYICDICGEEMDSYNKASVLRHLKKHEDANKVLEAEDAWHPTCPHCQGKVRPDGQGWVMCRFCGFSWEAPDLFRANEYGLWTEAQLDAPDAPWTPEVISPVFPLKGYEKPVEVVRAELQKHLVGQEIRMWHESHDPGFYYDFGFTEPQPHGTMGKVTGISEVNPNRPWVIGVWVTITTGGSEKHPIGSRVWFHVKDSHFPSSLYSGWHEGDYLPAGGLKAEGEEALYWATRTNMRDAEDYEISRWIKVLRDEDPEAWDDIDWEDDTVLPHDDDWHEDIEWEAENYFNYPRRTNPPKKSAAVLFVTNDGLVGLGLRSPRVMAGNTWAAIGGFSERGETPVQTIYREVYEELGIRLPNRVEWLGSDGLHEVYLCRIDKPFRNHRLNWEHTDFAWKTLEEWNHYPIHPQLLPLLRQKTFLTDTQEINGHGNIQAGGDVHITPAAYEKWLKEYKKKRKHWDWEDSLPSKPYADYWTSPKKNPQRAANQNRLNQGGLFLNWVKTFAPSIEGYKRQCSFFDIEPVPAQKPTRATDNDPFKSKPHDRPWKPPTEPQPWPWDNPYRPDYPRYPEEEYEK